ncbi:YIP1 family protein [Rhodovulum sp. 12E13]|jgi:hypothetical protein|uniref:Yip1 family protein n=1 Tax=Rhodovulum sp. 12E13 TaxID=2203891 RepID=UPI000E147463|nr:Yip1 family protein [Rhodovulum sp. 12E13]MEE4119807.1 Yip1 family protein [Paracoccaceae bacterium]RDC72214.1 YIP1 family protein [Rhodovulum sp. 12E13]
MSETALIPGLIRQTFSDPQGAARRLVALDLPAPVLWQALVLVVALSAMAAQVSSLLLSGGPAAEGEALLPFAQSPLLVGMIQGAILVIMVFAVHWIGRSFGGVGRIEDSIAAVTWLQFLLVCLQVVQLGVGFVSPALSGLVGLAGIVFFFWLLTQFVMAVHEFESAAMVFVMIVVSLLAIVFALSLVLTLLGLTVPGEAPNV